MSPASLKPATRLSLLLSLLAAGSAHSADREFTGADGSSWQTASHWTPSGVPNSSDRALIGSASNLGAYSVLSSSGTAQSVFAGYATSSNGRFDVTGSSTLLEIQYGLISGHYGTGTVNILNGAHVTAGAAQPINGTSTFSTVLGQESNSNGTMLIEGAGSKFSLIGNVYAGFGANSESTLTVKSGGSLVTLHNSQHSLILGYTATGSSEALFTDNGTLIDIGQIIVGNSGSASLTVENGAQIKTKISQTNSIAANLNSTSEALFTGAGTLWDATGGSATPSQHGNIVTGMRGAGKLTIENQAEVWSGAGEIGQQPTGSGEVFVSGTNSKWLMSGQLRIGAAGQGELTISDGGYVGADTVSIASTSAARGELTLGGTSGSRGALAARYVQEGTGSGGSLITFDGGELRALENTTNFLQNFEAGDIQIKNGGAFINTAGYDITISSVLQNAAGHSGRLTKQGDGILTLTAASTYTTGTVVESGSLILNGSLAGNVTVQNGASFGGTGTVIANMTVLAGGTHSPGNSPGLQNISLNYSNAGTFEVDLLIGGSGSPGNGFIGTDRVIVSGNVTLSGTIEVSAFGGSQANRFYAGDTLSTLKAMWVLVNNGSNPINGVFSNTTAVLGGGYNAILGGSSYAPYTFTQNGNTFLVFYDANFDTLSFGGGNDVLLILVPEPTRAVLALMALVGLVTRRKR